MQEKHFFGITDIMQRYECGEARAYRIIREVKRLCGATFGGSAKVLPAELEAWERKANDEKSA